MYNALVTDIDGTAVAISSNGSDIDAATKQTIQAAIKKGKKITCATGREWELTKNIVKSLGFISPCIVEGGTRIIDPTTEEIIWEKVLDEGASAKIFDVFKSESRDGLIMHSADLKRKKISDIESVPGSLRFIYLLAVDKVAAIKISNRINTSYYAVAHITPSWVGSGFVDVHVTHPEATKEHAIQIWQNLENVTKEETIGMGDSGNDVPIFQSAGYRVAVGNATAELKELADYIAPPVNEQALKYVVETILMA